MHAILLALALGQQAPEAQKPPPPSAASQEKQLSKEDEELVKELALLEKMELVQHLELFDDSDEQKPPPEKRQP